MLLQTLFSEILFSEILDQLKDLRDWEGRGSEWRLCLVGTVDEEKGSPKVGGGAGGCGAAAT